MLRFHNTLSGNTEAFTPLKTGEVKMYHCGPTVYGIQHIGNLSMFVFTDILRRTFEYSGIEVKQVINFTDFGHLTGDNKGTPDEGEDKMAKGLREAGLDQTLENMKIIAEKFSKVFLDDISKLNVRTEGTVFPFASEYINEQIDLIKSLEEKDFTYTTSDGLYYDISKFPTYGRLGNIQIGASNESRIGANSEKRNPEDFALWKSSEAIGWESPWGRGFPGWHIECSAMIIKILGPQIDIHTGGIEHVSIHHNNEIAQSEAATGLSPFSRFWLHRAHLQINDSKIAKSDGNVVYLSEIIERGFSPLAFRYFLLLSHYRTPTNFTWEGLQAAQNAHSKLRALMPSLVQNSADGVKNGKVNTEYTSLFLTTLENDLNTPEALAVVWKLAKDETVAPADKFATLLDFDRVLGLQLYSGKVEIPEEIQKLVNEREEARKAKDWTKADELRLKIEALGYKVKDTDKGQTVQKA